MNSNLNIIYEKYTNNCGHCYFSRPSGFLQKIKVLNFEEMEKKLHSTKGVNYRKNIFMYKTNSKEIDFQTFQASKKNKNGHYFSKINSESVFLKKWKFLNTF
jgi:hypothetical protein